MWGFNIKAYSGNTSFVRDRGASSEGELWMKNLFKKTVPEQLGKTMTGLLDGVEAQFSGVKTAVTNAVKGIYREFFLSLWDGDTGRPILTYHFKPDTPPEIIEHDFLWRLQRSGYKLGDQVMIQVCETIVQFENHLMTHQNEEKKAVLPTLVIEIYF